MAGSTRRSAALAALVFLVALNLRPSITAVGPVISQIGDDHGLGEGALGLLGALPLLAFAAVSPLVHRLSARIGTDRAVGAALGVLALGTLIRSGTGEVGLWIGTFVLGGAIAVGNVLVPSIVKRDYAANVSLATGLYSACMAVAASTASAVAVPLSDDVGWQGALAVWSIPAVVVALAWLPRTVAREAALDLTEDTPVVGSVWRRPDAWFVTAFMGLQSTAFYVMVTWLPTIETSRGVSEGQAGLHLFVFQIVGIAAGLTIPRLLRDPGSQVAAAAAASLPVLVGVLGLLALPDAGLLWSVLIGLGCGASLVVALTLISLRGRGHRETTQLSGMAQSLGYLFAALGPIATGLIAEGTGSWPAALGLVAAIALLQLLVGLRAGQVRATG